MGRQIVSLLFKKMILKSGATEGEGHHSIGKDVGKS
jgi:hypothetical protein